MTGWRCGAWLPLSAIPMSNQIGQRITCELVRHHAGRHSGQTCIPRARELGAHDWYDVEWWYPNGERKIRVIVQ